MTRIPSKSEILDWISANPTKAAKRDIAKAFGIKGAARIDLKRLLKELQDEGKLTKRRSSYRDAEERVVGAVGVIGPTRLNYARIIPMVDYTAQLVTRMMR